MCALQNWDWQNTALENTFGYFTCSAALQICIDKKFSWLFTSRRQGWVGTSWCGTCSLAPSKQAGVGRSMWRVVKLRITSIRTLPSRTLCCMITNKFCSPPPPHGPPCKGSLGSKLPECFRRNVVDGVAERSKSCSALSFEMCGCFPRVSSDSLTKDCWRKSCCIVQMAHSTFSSYSRTRLIRQSFIP